MTESENPPMTQEAQHHEFFTIARSRADLVAAWRDPDQMKHDGKVILKEVPGRGTVIGLSLRYEATEDDSAPKVASVIGKQPAEDIREEMRRFKQLMETGEIPSIEGQPSGRTPEEVKEKA